MSGYFMFRRAAIAGVTLNPLGYKILIEVIGRGRIGKVAEVGYVFRERTAGESKVTGQVYIDYLRHLVRLRLDSAAGRRASCASRWSACRAFSSTWAVLYLLSDPQTLGWGLTRSKVIAASTAILNNFLWNDAWTFRDSPRVSAGMRHRLRRLLKFNGRLWAGPRAQRGAAEPACSTSCT